MQHAVDGSGQMHMHFPQARHQETALAIERLGAGRRGQALADGGNATGAQQDTVAYETTAIRIEGAHIADQQRAVDPPRQALGACAIGEAFDLLLRGQQRRHVLGLAIADDAGPFADRGEQLPVGIEPDQTGRQIDPVDRIQRQRLTGELSSHLFFDARTACRKQTQRMVLGSQQRARQDRGFFGWPLKRQIERGHGGVAVPDSPPLRQFDFPLLRT